MIFALKCRHSTPWLKASDLFPNVTTHSAMVRPSLGRRDLNSVCYARWDSLQCDRGPPRKLAAGSVKRRLRRPKRPLPLRSRICLAENVVDFPIDPVVAPLTPDAFRRQVKSLI